MQAAAAERSYPISEVRGSGLECQAATAQELRRGATPHPRSGAVTERCYPASEVRGDGPEELSHFQGQGQRPGGATPHLRPGAVTEMSNPILEARSGDREEQPHVQGAVAAWAPEGLEELFHIQGWEG